MKKSYRKNRIAKAGKYPVIEKVSRYVIVKKKSKAGVEYTDYKRIFVPKNPQNIS